MASGSKGKYNYDPVDLIEFVEARPCLWNKTREDYKDRQKKARAWDEVYAFLIPNFDNLREAEQVAIGKTIREKWKHIRDAFSQSLKKRSGDQRHKQYVYFNELQFLIKFLDKDETVSSISDPLDLQLSEEEESSSPTQHLDPVPRPSSSGRKRFKPSNGDETERVLIKASESTSQAFQEMDEDVAFFVSVLPSVKKFSDEQKLDFRMGVLSLIKDIKQQGQQWSHSMETHGDYK